MKTCFILYLILPSTRGAVVLHEKVVKPMFSQRKIAPTTTSGTTTARARSSSREDELKDRESESMYIEKQRWLRGQSRAALAGKDRLSRSAVTDLSARDDDEEELLH